MSQNGSYCQAHEETKKLYARLDEQQQSLTQLVGILEGQTNALIEAVMGKRQVPLFSHLIVVAALTTVIFVLLIRDSDKSLKFNKDGFSLGQSESK